MAIWNNVFSCFPKDCLPMRTWSGVCCMCYASLFKSASPLHSPQSLPSKLDKTHPTGPDMYRFLPPGRATWSSATAISKEAELLFQLKIAPSQSCCWCWSLRTQTYARFPMQTDWNYKLVMQTFGESQGTCLLYQLPSISYQEKVLRQVSCVNRPKK